MLVAIKFSISLHRNLK